MAIGTMGCRMCIHHGIISMSQMNSTVRVWKESSKISSKLGRLLAQMLALLRTPQSGNKQNTTNMNKKNTRLVSALNHAAALVGERQSLNGMETGLGLTLQRDRCLEEVRTITDGLFRVVVMGTFTSGKSTLVNAL